MINHKHKFIFIHIPRTGGTSIEKSLLGEDFVKPKDIYKKGIAKHITLVDALKRYKEICFTELYLSFVFVRNPWSRLVSIWKSPYYLDQKLKGFEHFLINFHPEKHEQPSINQYDSIAHPTEKIGFIGRFENIVEDFEKLKELLKLSDDVKLLKYYEGHFFNVKNNFEWICNKYKVVPEQILDLIKPEEKKHYTEYYNTTTQEIVEKRCKSDIDFFNYSFK